MQGNLHGQAPANAALADHAERSRYNSAMHILNISAYKFVPLPDTAELRPRFQERVRALGLKGTILLSPEGINLFVAGVENAVREFLLWLNSEPRFADIVGKESWSDHQPFNRMLVKLKREIITMNMPMIQPAAGRAPALPSATLKRWLDQGHDDAGREIVMLDTRNKFEVDVGTFENAIEYGIKSFSEFPPQLEKHREDFTGKTIVSFCTGGIRCEKAAIHMHNIGLEHSYQLEGGILKYFEEVGGAHWQGDCFVFDKRVAVTPQLEEAEFAQCYACRAVVTKEERRSPQYVEGKSCPHCWEAGK